MLTDNAITPHLALNSLLHGCYQRGLTSSSISILSGGAAFLHTYTIYFVKRPAARLAISAGTRSPSSRCTLRFTGS